MYRQRWNKATALLIVTCLVAAPGFAQAQGQPRSAEWGVESSTEIVQLPLSLPSPLAFRPCGTCELLKLRLDESTQLRIGEHTVSLAQMHRYANRGPAGLVVIYDKGSKRVTQVILDARLDAADLPPQTTERKPK